MTILLPFRVLVWIRNVLFGSIFIAIGVGSYSVIELKSAIEKQKRTLYQLRLEQEIDLNKILFFVDRSASGVEMDWETMIRNAIPKIRSEIPLAKVDFVESSDYLGGLLRSAGGFSQMHKLLEDYPIMIVACDGLDLGHKKFEGDGYIVLSKNPGNVHYKILDSASYEKAHFNFHEDLLNIYQDTTKTNHDLTIMEGS